MRRPIAALLAIFILLVLVVAPAMAKTATTGPQAAMLQAPAVTVMGDNTIAGAVYDMNGKGIPNAKVTLYYTSWTGADYKAKGVFKANNNPQNTSDGQVASAGLYVFTGIPDDVYMLTAEKDGKLVSQLVDVRGGTKTQDLTIDGYWVKDTTPLPSATSRPTPGASAVPGLDVGAIFMAMLNVALMGIIGIQFIVSIAVIVLHIGRKS